MNLGVNVGLFSDKSICLGCVVLICFSSLQGLIFAFWYWCHLVSVCMWCVSVLVGP